MQTIVQNRQLSNYIWSFPIIFLIHDLEEIFTVEAFLAKHPGIPFHVNTLQFTAAFLLLWIVSTIGCYHTLKNRSFLGLSPKTLFCFLVPGILLANGIGHLLQALFFQSYTPGVVTSVLVIFPYSYLTIRTLTEIGWLTKRSLVLNLLIGFVAQGPFALASLMIGKLVA
jgi:hypothetical protein